MLACAQACWNALMASSMAFFCAEEPSALRSPEKHSALLAALVPPEEVLPPSAGWVGFSEAQAESARAPVRARAPRALIRDADTGVDPSRWSGSVSRRLFVQRRCWTRSALEVRSRRCPERHFW